VISGASDPVWSPSGSHLTYLHGSQGRSRLLLAHEDGSGAVAVTADVVGTPIWSPDNLRLAFASETTGQIATLSVAKPFRHRSISHEPRGSVLTPLAYSHDGRRIFYTATAVSHGASPISATNLNVWTINPDGSGLTQLTSSTASDDRAPAWSPDGSRIAFSRQSGPDPTTDRASIFSVAASGGNPIQLTADAAKFDTDPAWSPNGTKIAFVRQAGNTSSDLFLINADGSGLRRLTSGNDVGAPVWSPDGSKIAFSGLNGNSPGLFIVGADGSVLRQPEGGWPSTPSWSPDGKKLAYVVSWGADPSVDLVVESADGSDHGPQVYQRCGDKFGQAGKYIAWSPDGSRIAFVCGASFGGDSPATWLFVASTDGSDLRKIVTVPVNKNDFDPIRSPSWSPDSKSLVYEATVDLPNAGTRQSIFTVAADGSKPIELTPFPTDSLDPTRSR
jgi:Tol biopolymer transport system component